MDPGLPGAAGDALGQGSCLHIAKTATFKPGAEDALIKLGWEFYNRNFGEKAGEQAHVDNTPKSETTPAQEENEGNFTEDASTAEAALGRTDGDAETFPLANSHIAPRGLNPDARVSNIRANEDDIQQAEWTTERAELVAKISELEAATHNFKAEKLSWDSERENLNSTIESRQQECWDVGKKVDEEKAARANLETLVAQREAEGALMSAEVEELRSQVDALANLENELSDAKTHAEQLEEENGSLKAQVEKLNSSMVYAKNQFHKLKQVKEEKVAAAASLTQKVEEMEEEKTSLLAQLTEAETRAQDQRGEIEAALKELQSSNASLLESLEESRTKESTLAQSKIDLEGELNALRQDISLKEADLGERENGLKLSLEGKEAELVSLRDEVEAIFQEKVDLESQVQEQEARIASLTGEKESMEGKMRYAKQQFEKLKKLNEDKAMTIEEQKSEMASYMSELDSLRIKIAESEVSTSMQEEMQNKIGIMESELTTFREVSEKNEEKRLELERRLAVAEEQVSEADVQMDFLRTQLDESMSSLQVQEKAAEENSQQLVQKAAEAAKLHDELQALVQVRERSEALEAQLESACQNMHGMEQQLQDKDSSLKECVKQIGELEEKVEYLASGAERLQNADSLLEQAEEEIHRLQQALADQESEVANKSKAISDLTVQLSELSHVQEMADQANAQLQESHLVQEALQARENELLLKNQLVLDYEQRLSQVPHLEAGIQERDSALVSRSEEISRLNLQIENLSKSLADADGAKAQLNGALEQLRALQTEMESSKLIADQELTEALEIAELADGQLQDANHKISKLEDELHNVTQALEDRKGALDTQEKENSALREEIAGGRETLQSYTKLEIELQGTKARLEVAEGELQNLRQESAEGESAKRNLSMAQREMASLQAELVDSQAMCQKLSTGEEQTAAELANARHEVECLQQKTREYEVAVAALEAAKAKSAAEESQGSQMLQDLQDKAQLLQQQIETANEEVQGAKGQLEFRLQENESLRQKVFQLETALAVAGPPSSVAGTQYVTPATNAGSPVSTATPVQAMSDPMDPEIQMKLESLMKELSDTRLVEVSLRTELDGVRMELEGERSQRMEAQRLLEQRPSAGRSDAIAVNLEGGTNKKDEDLIDVEAAVLSGGDASGFQPIAGLIRGVAFMKFLGPCIQGADLLDRGFIILMRQPILRIVLLMYFLILHVVFFT